MKRRITIKEFLHKQVLLVGILACIFAAAVHPEFGSRQGPLYTEYSVKYGAVSLIFFISGLSLKTELIEHTFHHYKLHLFIQSFTFILIPTFSHLFVRFLHFFGINSWVLKGLVTVACMPPPVSSAVILTRSANGNETAAIFNSVLGSFLGIIITPLLLFLGLGYTTLIPLFGTIIQLITTVLIPLTLGQVLRKITGLKRLHPALNTLSQCALLFVLYTTFCDTFKTPEPHIEALDVLAAVFSVVLMQMILMGLSYSLAQYYNSDFSSQDIIAIMFCSTHKSLTLGIPILRIMFHGYAHLSQVSLPLLVYHPTQIILGGMMVSQLKDWVHLDRSGNRPPV
ncbi:sodium/bile acid cotransporter 7-B-like [Zophobas morio]|uniref:sodium/bile acid cotransporter 7-B-like n=1 Tax=Zophobas morio TaxID=2755281 RepID=UPI003083BC76